MDLSYCTSFKSTNDSILVYSPVSANLEFYSLFYARNILSSFLIDSISASRMFSYGLSCFCCYSESSD